MVYKGAKLVVYGCVIVLEKGYDGVGTVEGYSGYNGGVRWRGPVGAVEG